MSHINIIIRNVIVLDILTLNQLNPNKIIVNTTFTFTEIRFFCKKEGVSTSPEVPSRCSCIRKACLIVIIAYGNVLTRNDVEIVSKSSFSIVCRMAPMLALLGGVLITPLSGHIQTSK